MMGIRRMPLQSKPSFWVLFTRSSLLGNAKKTKQLINLRLFFYRNNPKGYENACLLIMA